jgi:hypothetical protein
MKKLIPELADWNDGKGIDVRSWISCVGNYEHAIGYTEIFWPSFEYYDGCIFFKGFSKSNYHEWLENQKGNKLAVQAVVNHTHILDLFPNVDEQPSEQQVIFLGQTLKNMWHQKLKIDFPNHNCVVLFEEENCDDLLSYEITFFISE